MIHPTDGHRSPRITRRLLATIAAVLCLHLPLGAAGPDVFRDHAGRSDRASGLVVDAVGNFYLPGYMEKADGTSSFSVVKHRAAGPVEWIGTYNGVSGGSTGSAFAADVDAAGNVYAAGYVYAGGSSSGALDCLVVKFDANGIQRWSLRYDGPGHNYDTARQVVVDGAGNVYVTGRSYGASSDWATLKISSAGALIWVQRFDSAIGGSDDEPVEMALDGSGNIVVVGRAANAAGTFGNDVKIITYNPAGQILWQGAFTETAQSDDIVYGMALDPAGRVVITGQTSATPSPEQPIVPFLLSYAPGGQLTFAVTDATAGGSAVTIDAQSNIFVTGTSAPDFATPFSAVTKFTAAGARLWTRPIPDTSAASVSLYRVAVDSGGAAYVAGAAVDRSTSTRDFLTIKLSAAGDVLWQHRYNGSGNGNDDVSGLVVDAGGSVLVTGTAWGGYVSSGGTDFDMVTLRYAKGSDPTSGQVPVAPSSLAVQSAASTKVTLRWNDRSTDESGFRIERCLGNACTGFSAVAQVGSGVVTYSDTSVVKSTMYSYRVLAINGAGASLPSNSVSVQTPKK